MRPRVLLVWFVLVGLLLIQPLAVWAQAPSGTSNSSLPADVFAWYKLLILAFVYLSWVFLSDVLNRDLLRWGRQMGLSPEVWNLVNVLCFLAAFVLVLAIPLFWASLPVLVLAAWLPPIIYRSVRKGRIAADVELQFRVSGGKEGVSNEPLRQDEGVMFEFIPAGDDEDQQAANLIRARQSPNFVTMKELLVTGITNRSDVILLDYTRQAVAGKMLVDGAWHNLPWMDRAMGDAVLFSLKSLAGLNPADRRSQQSGAFQVKWLDMSLKASFELTTAGVPTGERAQLKTLRGITQDLPLSQLGMWPEMQTQFVGAMNSPGIILISAPPRMGLTSTWRSALLASDRITRDCMGLIPEKDTETELENVQVRRYNANNIADVFRGLLLMQPDAIVVTELLQTTLVDRMAGEVLEHGKSIFSRTVAENAVECLLKFLSRAPNKPLFAKAVTAVTGQRLLRRLCDHCKQPVMVRPEAIQKLGGDPRRQNTIYNHFQLPPPEQRIDDKGQPIEMFPCPVCQGLGFIGRIAVFELILVDDGLRGILLKEPKADRIAAYLRSKGQLSQLQQAYRLVLAGVTSIAEVQRVFAKGPG